MAAFASRTSTPPRNTAWRTAVIGEIEPALGALPSRYAAMGDPAEQRGIVGSAVRWRSRPWSGGRGRPGGTGLPASAFSQSPRAAWATSTRRASGRPCRQDPLRSSAAKGPAASAPTAKRLAQCRAFPQRSWHRRAAQLVEIEAPCLRSRSASPSRASAGTPGDIEIVGAPTGSGSRSAVFRTLWPSRRRPEALTNSLRSSLRRSIRPCPGTGTNPAGRRCGARSRLTGRSDLAVEVPQSLFVRSAGAIEISRRLSQPG